MRSLVALQGTYLAILQEDIYQCHRCYINIPPYYRVLKDSHTLEKGKKKNKEVKGGGLRVVQS